MNTFLTEMYNTGENIGVIGGGVALDTEKLAEAELLNDLFREEGVNVDAMSPEQIVKVASEIFGPESPLVKSAMEGEAACKCGKSDCGCGCKGDASKCKCGEKTAAAPASAPVPALVASAEGDEALEEKIAHADTMGRIMAHSFIAEWADMEKAAQVEMTKQAKLQALQEVAPAAPAEVTSAQSLLAKIAAGNAPAAPAINQDLAAKAFAMLKEAGVPFPEA